MLNKFALLIMSSFLLSLLLLVPDAHAKAVSSEESSELSPRLEIFAVMFAEFRALSKFALKESVPIYKKVLTDLQSKSEKSEELEGYVKDINDFIANIEKHGAFDEVNNDLMKAYFQYSTLTSKFVPADDDDDAKEQKQISADATLVKELLEKHGIETLEKELEKHVDKFAKTLTEAIEKYANTLNDEEKAKESKFFEWFKKFKDAEDADAKMAKIIDIIIVD